MTDVYINIPSTPDQWVRPVEWMPMPNITPGEQKIAILYGVYENDWNFMNVRFSSIAGYIDWGDGTSGSVNGNVVEDHVYDYSTITGSVYQDEFGENYKQVMIIATGSGGTYSVIQLPYTPTYNSLGGRNVLDYTFSWDGSTYLTTNGTFTRCQRLRYLANDIGVNVNSYYDNKWISLRYLELPGSGSIDQVTSAQATFRGLGPIQAQDFYLDNTGTCNSLFQNSRFKKLNNIQIDNSTILSNLFTGCDDLEELGNITALSATSLVSLISGCPALQKIGTINAPNATTIQTAFNACYSLKEIIFTDCSNITTTTSAFLNARSLRSLRMPNIAASFSVANCAMQRDALVTLFNDLATTTATITITGNPGVPDLSAADLQIATDKGWTVTS